MCCENEWLTVFTDQEVLHCKGGYGDDMKNSNISWQRQQIFHATQIDENSGGCPERILQSFSLQGTVFVQIKKSISLHLQIPSKEILVVSPSTRDTG